MAHKTDPEVNVGSWNVHLRPYGKRCVNKKVRKKSNQLANQEKNLINDKSIMDSKMAEATYGEDAVEELIVQESSLQKPTPKRKKLPNKKRKYGVHMIGSGHWMKGGYTQWYETEKQRDVALAQKIKGQNHQWETAFELKFIAVNR